MIAAVFAPKFLALYGLIGSGIYTHYRGKARFKFLRQLTDHSTFMAPINAIMYLFSAVPNKPYLDVSDFPELQVFKDNWETIRADAERLREKGYIKASDDYNDIGFNSFFRQGWKRFYLKWYDDALPSAKELCPRSVELVNNVPNIKAAMFTLLPPGGKLMLHRDPYAGSLRYHLGLITPNSDDCRIYVDDEMYAWRDGEDVLFDETYLHYAVNETDEDRIIFFCDIERPMCNRVATSLNRWFSKTVMKAAATKNLDEDRIGGINKGFKYIYQVRLMFKRLKAYNERLYYFVKYAGFSLLFYLLFF